MNILKSQTLKPEKQLELENRINLELAEFFETEPREIKVIIHDSKDSLNQSWRKSSDHSEDEQIPDWLVAYATYGDDIHILSPDVIPAAHEKTRYQRFQKTLKHELSHLYINDINSKLPSWLTEGSSLYIAGQNHYKLVDSNEITIDLLYELDAAPTDGRIYPVGINMVNRIIENYGKQKLFEILAMKSNKERYIELKRLFDWLK